jgi:hypothetical protein
LSDVKEVFERTSNLSVPIPKTPALQLKIVENSNLPQSKLSQIVVSSGLGSDIPPSENMENRISTVDARPSIGG